MELKLNSRPDVSYSGNDDIKILSGKRFKIKAADLSILNEKVPNGKKWVVGIIVNVIETSV